MFTILALGGMVIDCRPGRPWYGDTTMDGFDVYVSPEPAWPGQPVPASAEPYVPPAEPPAEAA